MMQDRPEFKNYPLKAEELRQIYEDNVNLDKEIKENNNQIHILNSKIAKTDYQRQLLIKLQNKERILSEKKRELSEIVQTQRYIQDQIRIKKLAQGEVKNNLANEYKKAMEEKRARLQQQKKSEIEKERMAQFHNMIMISQDVKRKKQQAMEFKKSVQEELQIKEMMKQKEELDKIREKQVYNEKTRHLSLIQTQKQSSYKQYYDQFKQQQNKLQNLYEVRTQAAEVEKQMMRNSLVRRGIEQNNMRNLKDYEEKVNKISKERQQLRNSLLQQIESKEHKKLQEKNQHRKLAELSQHYSYQNMEMEMLEKQKKKEQQKKYDQNLKNQVKLKQSIYQINQPTSSPKASSLHNPITNPIDFKIGITNPYIVQAYENSKQKYLNDNQLKLRNLAMLGNKSLNKWTGPI